MISFEKRLFSGSEVVFGPDQVTGLRKGIMYPVWVPAAGRGPSGASPAQTPDPGAGWDEGVVGLSLFLPDRFFPSPIPLGTERGNKAWQ